MIAAVRRRVQDYLSRHRLLRFAWRTIKSALIIVIIFTLLAWVPDQPAQAAWLFFYSLPFILVALVWFLIRLGIRHGFSAVISIFAAIGILSAVQYHFMRRDAELAAFANFDAPLQPGEDVEIVDLSDLMPSCGIGCMEVIANTKYRVFLDDHQYWAIRGDVCRTLAFRDSYYALLQAGYSSTCRAEAKTARPTRMLVIEKSRCNRRGDDHADCDQLPTSFGGQIVTVRLVSADSDRIVHRWLEGGILPYNGWFALVGLEQLSVGKWLDLAETLSRALGTEIKISNVTGKDDLDAVLTELEIFLDIPEYAENAPQAFWSLSHVRGRENQHVLRAHIAALIMRDDRAHILAGLNLVTHQSAVNVDDHRSRISQLVKGTDPVISDFAQRALRHIGH